MSVAKKASRYWLPIGLILLYLATHLSGLVSLPVFADEAIYIRWSQLIMDEPLRYLFFALNDGKTPLLIWLFVPFQYLISDSLAAGRVVSVLAGLVQVYVMILLIKSLGGKKIATYITALATILLPFFYFYSRMALMDALLTLWLSLSFWSTIKMVNTPERIAKIKWSAVIGLFLGLAYWTKLPAVLFIPSLFTFVALSTLRDRQKLWLNLIMIIGGTGMGTLMFFLLKISPAFSQLFSRGSDFLFPISSLFQPEIWQRIPGVFAKLIWELGMMLSWPVLLAPIIGLLTKDRGKHLKLLVAWLAFCLPILILGKVVYLRYYLPGAIFPVISFGLLIEYLWQINSLKTKNWWVLRQSRLLFILVLILLQSVVFITFSVFKSDRLPLPTSEFEQYLGDWSSGHGVKEIINKLISESHQNKIAVATEGFFGTLPDAMLMYLHNRDVNRIWVEGIGQPVGAIPDSFWQHAQRLRADQYWLVVNSHRMKIENPDIKLIDQWCRPENKPCLQLWDISMLKKIPG